MTTTATLQCKYCVKNPGQKYLRTVLEMFRLHHSQSASGTWWSKATPSPSHLQLALVRRIHWGSSFANVVQTRLHRLLSPAQILLLAPLPIMTSAARLTRAHRALPLEAVAGARTAVLVKKVRQYYLPLSSNVTSGDFYGSDSYCPTDYWNYASCPVEPVTCSASSCSDCFGQTGCVWCATATSCITRLSANSTCLNGHYTEAAQCTAPGKVSNALQINAVDVLLSALSALVMYL